MPVTTTLRGCSSPCSIRIGSNGAYWHQTWECAGLLQPAKRWLCPEQDIAGDGGGCASADFAALVMLLSTVEYWPTIPPVHAVMPLP
eukprot:1157375-Pelagomonas_calceolata.AAC.9